MKINKTTEQQESQLRKLGFKLLEENNDTYFPVGTYMAKKDKLIVYYANIEAEVFVATIETEEDTLPIGDFHNLDQLLTSFKKAKLVF